MIDCKFCRCPEKRKKKLYTCTHHLCGNDIGQKCEGNCGLWVLNEIVKRMYPESLKKIVGAVWELPAK